MLPYIIRRILLVIPTLIVIMAINFAIVQFELISLVFIIRIFDVKLFTTTKRAFHSCIPDNSIQYH